MKETVRSKLQVERKDIFFIYELCLSHGQKCVGEGKRCTVEETLEEESEEVVLGRQLEEG